MTPTAPAAELLSVAEVAAVLHVSRSTAYELVRNRTVPAIRLGGSIRIPRSALDRWLTDREREALASVHSEAVP